MTIKQINKLLEFRVKGIRKVFHHEGGQWTVYIHQYRSDNDGFITGPVNCIEWGPRRHIKTYDMAIFVANCHNVWFDTVHGQLREASLRMRAFVDSIKQVQRANTILLTKQEACEYYQEQLECLQYP